MEWKEIWVTARHAEVAPWRTSESKVTLECSFSHDIHVSDLSADCSCDEYDLVAEANWIFSLRSSWNEARPSREMLLTGGSLFATKGKSVAPGNRDITRLWNDTDFRVAPCLLLLTTYLRVQGPLIKFIWSCRHWNRNAVYNSTFLRPRIITKNGNKFIRAGKS